MERFKEVYLFRRKDNRLFVTIKRPEIKFDTWDGTPYFIEDKGLIAEIREDLCEDLVPSQYRKYRINFEKINNE